MFSVSRPTRGGREGGGKQKRSGPFLQKVGPIFTKGQTKGPTKGPTKGQLLQSPPEAAQPNQGEKTKGPTKGLTKGQTKGQTKGPTKGPTKGHVY